jgi:carboxymethylenebutenolidase
MVNFGRSVIAAAALATIAAAGVDLADAQPAEGASSGAAPPEPAEGGPPPGAFGKRPDLPASVWNASSTVARTMHQSEWVEIPIGDGVELRTWVEYPDGNAPAPVIIVLQYEGGLDDWVRAIADQLASEGFIAVAPDLFSGLGPGGGGTDSFRTQDEAMRVGRDTLTPDEAIRRAVAAAAHAAELPRANGKIAAMGFGSGGAYSFRLAADAPSVDAAVVFYGSAPDEAVMSRIKAPVIAFHGADDPRVSSTVGQTAAVMERLGKRFEHHTYQGATRDFALIQIEGLNTPAIEDAWTRAVAFLREHLQ